MGGGLARRRGHASLLENAYYGARRPAGQLRVALRRVDDLLRMGRATLEEGRALVCWLQAQGYAVCVTGYSMGGHMAAAVAATAPEPVAAAISGAGITVSGIFTRGLLARQIAWSRLGEGARERLATALSVVDIDRRDPPPRLDATVVLAARRDGYVEPHVVHALADHWRGADVRWLEGGHVSAYLWSREAQRTAIRDAVDRL